MNALELADELDHKSDLGEFKHYEAAALLRRQYSDLAIAHEAIVKLRKAATDALYVLEAWERDCDQTLYWRDHHEAVKAAREALKDTEEFQ